LTSHQGGSAKWPLSWAWLFSSGEEPGLKAQADIGSAGRLIGLQRHGTGKRHPLPLRLIPKTEGQTIFDEADLIHAHTPTDAVADCVLIGATMEAKVVIHSKYVIFWVVEVVVLDISSRRFPSGSPASGPVTRKTEKS
jgi:hypothetical protein